MTSTLVTLTPRIEVIHTFESANLDQALDQLKISATIFGDDTPLALYDEDMRWRASISEGTVTVNTLWNVR